MKKNKITLINIYFYINILIIIFLGLITIESLTAYASTPQLNKEGLVAWYAFNESTGQVLKDYSGNGNNGQLGSTIGIDTNDPIWSNNGLTFFINNEVIVPNSTSIGLTGDYTFIAIVNPYSDGGGHNARIIDKNNNGAYTFGLAPGGYIRTYTASGDFVCSNPLAYNQFYIVAARCNVPLQLNELYVNNILQATNSGVSQLNIRSNPLIIGNREALDRNWNGTISYLLLYNRMLSTSELNDVSFFLKSEMKNRGISLNITEQSPDSMINGYNHDIMHMINGSMDGQLTNYPMTYLISNDNGTSHDNIIYLNGGAFNFPYDISFTDNYLPSLKKYPFKQNSYNGTWLNVTVNIPNIPMGQNSFTWFVLWYGSNSCLNYGYGTVLFKSTLHKPTDTIYSLPENNIVVFGASSVNRSNGDIYAWLKYPAYSWLNSGISGANVSSYPARYYSTCGGYNPKYVIFWLGNNDIAKGSTDKDVELYIDTLKNLAENEGSTPVFITQHARNSFTDQMYTYNHNVNKWILNTASTYNYPYLDEETLAADPNHSKQINPILNGDGTHLNDIGNRWVGSNTTIVYPPQQLSTIPSSNQSENSPIIGYQNSTILVVDWASLVVNPLAWGLIIIFILCILGWLFIRR